ncbi:hypothetical protein ASPVEDRAFT_89632 [Aspergillus versicolor CBS 583.65]|uniref:Uncharacterized protein n=1 Tax=Aspergillus versicolor CBS 583.65 TaxID=1036611 RepID=A0A1L9Q3S4_ASPVE|nr:uncharacterized protein ASPVEDRAFT_89632 [Aspergillus versicolor CBS 583.65]OJJ08411.1 hypothetical protein ASPVEDRAFT_89632 [Aspergillus versicolor CBS 583.65]
MTHPMRIIVYVCVSDIPGHPQCRHIALGEAVCRDILGRKFHAIPRPALYDHVHIPADFDSSLPINRWFIFDLNVREALSPNDVKRIAHQVYFASRQGSEWIFIQRDRSNEKARSQTASLTWGGRSEQEIVSEMRKEQKLVMEMRKQSGRLQNPSYDAS